MHARGSKCTQVQVSRMLKQVTVSSNTHASSTSKQAPTRPLRYSNLVQCRSKVIEQLFYQVYNEIRFSFFRSLTHTIYGNCITHRTCIPAQMSSTQCSLIYFHTRCVVRSKCSPVAAELIITITAINDHSINSKHDNAPICTALVVPEHGEPLNIKTQGLSYLYLFIFDNIPAQVLSIQVIIIIQKDVLIYFVSKYILPSTQVRRKVRQSKDLFLLAWSSICTYRNTQVRMLRKLLRRPSCSTHADASELASYIAATYHVILLPFLHKRMSIVIILFLLIPAYKECVFIFL